MLFKCPQCGNLITDSISQCVFCGYTSSSRSSDFLIMGTTLLSYMGNDEVVSIPEGVTIIDRCAFSSNKNIKNVIIPSSVLSIKEHAFTMCENLKEISYILRRNQLMEIGE